MIRKILHMFNAGRNTELNAKAIEAHEIQMPNVKTL